MFGARVPSLIEAICTRRNELTRIRGVRQKAGTADAGGEEVWRLVLPLVAVLGGALSADRLARPILRVREPPDSQGPVIVKAQLL